MPNRGLSSNEWASMRGSLLAMIAVSASLSVTGCRLLGRERSVSQSLIASRQFCQQGVAAMERGEWQRANELLAKAVRTCPLDADAHRYYAEVLWQRDRREEAIAELEEASRLAVDDPELHVLLAEKRLAMGGLELARQSAKYAIDLDPKLADAWAVRGRVRRADRRLRQALDDYLRALGLAPDDRRILLEVAELYRELKQPERALATLQRLGDTYSPGEEPQHVLYLEGLAYSAMGRWDEAAVSFATASVREPPTSEILFRLGEAELLAGRPARAAAAAQEALTLDPLHEPSRELLARAQVVPDPDDRIKR